MGGERHKISLGYLMFGIHFNKLIGTITTRTLLLFFCLIQTSPHSNSFFMKRFRCAE